MLLSVLLLLVSSTEASHLYGTVMTYYPQESHTDGSLKVICRYKLSSHGCSSDSWVCSGNCGNQTLVVNTTENEQSENWCQVEGIITILAPTNAPFTQTLNTGDWINNLKNNIVNLRAETTVELRIRSDTGNPNSSPQTTIMPAIRVPSNCQRDFDLLAFDPDGDEVKCRYGSSGSECNPCTPASVLSVSTSCTLSFSPTNSSDEGPYAVQLVMEDFPRQNITLTQTNGSQVARTTNEAISKIPVQFLFAVDPAVPDCTDGIYLPRFLPPTPDNRALLNAMVDNVLEISIAAQASTATISELLFSGPFNMTYITQGALGPGRFRLRWTPSKSEAGTSQPICFVAKAVYIGTSYHSDLRCVTVSVGRDVVALKVRLSTSLQLSEITSDGALELAKETLVAYGLPPDVTLRIASARQLPS
ncbi:uncharacterized protein FYW49_012775 [Xenentodon cancila]